MDNALLRIPALDETGIKKFYNGPGELHPRQPVHPGRGPRAARTSSSAPASTRSASPRPAGPGRALAEWIVDGEPTTDLTGVDIRRFAPLQRQRPLAARPGRRGARSALRDALAEPRADHRPAVPPLAGATTCWRRRTPASAAGWAGSGPTSSPRPGSSRPSSTPGASRTGCRGRRPSRSTPAPTSLCSTRPRSPSTWSVGPDAEAGAAVAVHRRRRRPARPHGLHRDAQRARHLRVRRHRDPAGARASSCSSAAPPPPSATRTTSAAGCPRAAARRRRRRDLGLRGVRRDGAAVARAAGPTQSTPTWATRRSRSAPAARSTWATPRCGRPGSPTSASWAGSSTSRPSSRSASTRT